MERCCSVSVLVLCLLAGFSLGDDGKMRIKKSHSIWDGLRIKRSVPFVEGERIKRSDPIPDRLRIKRSESYLDSLLRSREQLYSMWAKSAEGTTMSTTYQTSSTPSTFSSSTPTTTHMMHKVEFRLVGLAKEGRVEVQDPDSGEWQTMCDKLVTNDDAESICITLGFGGGQKLPPSYYGQGTGGIFAYKMNCFGDYDVASDCWEFQTFDPERMGCGHEHDVSIRCHDAVKVRLAGNDDQVVKSGRLEVREEKVSDTWHTVCPAHVNDAGIKLACKMLGFYTGERMEEPDFGPGTAAKTTKTWNCDPYFEERDQNLDDCRSVTADACGDDQYVGVRCYDEPKYRLRNSHLDEDVLEVSLGWEGPWYPVCQKPSRHYIALTNLTCQFLGYGFGELSEKSGLQEADSGRDAYTIQCGQSATSLKKCEHQRRSGAGCKELVIKCGPSSTVDTLFGDTNATTQSSTSTTSSTTESSISTTSSTTESSTSSTSSTTESSTSSTSSTTESSTLTSSSTTESSTLTSSSTTESSTLTSSSTTESSTSESTSTTESSTSDSTTNSTTTKSTTKASSQSAAPAIAPADAAEAGEKAGEPQSVAVEEAKDPIGDFNSEAAIPSDEELDPVGAQDGHANSTGASESPAKGRSTTTSPAARPTTLISEQSTGLAELAQHSPNTTTNVDLAELPPQDDPAAASASDDSGAASGNSAATSEHSSKTTTTLDPGAVPLLDDPGADPLLDDAAASISSNSTTSGNLNRTSSGISNETIAVNTTSSVLLSTNHGQGGGLENDAPGSAMAPVLTTSLRLLSCIVVVLFL